jgi:hypothetical protein
MFKSGRLTLQGGEYELPGVEVPQGRLHAASEDPGVVADALVAGAHVSYFEGNVMLISSK